jgi:hypothetical protein
MKQEKIFSTPGDMILFILFLCSLTCLGYCLKFAWALIIIIVVNYRYPLGAVEIPDLLIATGSILSLICLSSSSYRRKIGKIISIIFPSKWVHE